MNRIAVVGSTGSIGRNTLDVIAQYPDRFQLSGLAVRSGIEALAGQVSAWHPRQVVVWDAARAKVFADEHPGIAVSSGPEGLIRLVTDPQVDTVVFAASGCDTLAALIRAIEAGKRIAFATKELLVMAGELVMQLVRRHGAELIPIDSEHAALSQCLQGVSKEQIYRLVITASGGPLWGRSSAEISSATKEQVLAHPKWQMGRKITVDSATWMNKGLELIEARWLFDMPLEKLSVIIHPEAAVHALVEMVDGSLVAQLSACDMRLPIQYALSFPDRLPGPVKRLPLASLPGLHFYEPDLAQFPCLRLAMDAAAAGGTACVVLNAANETAVRAYLEDQIGFTDIPHVIENALEQHSHVAHPALEAILQADQWARACAQEMIASCSLS